MTSAPISSPLVTICICTFHRPLGLRALLESLTKLAPEGPVFDVVVVDNDKAASARDLVGTFSDRDFQITYAVEPVQNIALARNRTVSLARGRWLAFVDDDETVDSQWLVALFRQLRISQRGSGTIDAVMGRVEPRYSAVVPRWIMQGEYFEEERREPGETLLWWNLSTANVLIDATKLRAETAAFNPDYGLTGGEDSDMFCRLMSAGGQIVAAPEAVVFENVPPYRTTFSWLVRRNFRNGIIFALMEHHKAKPTHPTTGDTVRWVVSNLGASLVHLAKALLILPFRPAVSGTELMRSVALAGQAAGAVGINFESYRHPQPEPHSVA